MPTLLDAAAIVAVLVAIAHSVLGERLIFRLLREGSIVPTRPAGPLSSRHVRILWASWHLASVFGLALAWVLSASDSTGGVSAVVSTPVVCSAGFAAASALVLVATRGRHPGWIGLLLVAALGLAASH